MSVSCQGIATNLRKLLLLLALLALCGCELAYAARWCHGQTVSAGQSARTSCHGDAPADEAQPDQASCPGNELIPDIGAPAFIPASFAGHDFTASAEPRGQRLCRAEVRAAYARAGPNLSALCRRLI